MCHLYAWDSLFTGCHIGEQEMMITPWAKLSRPLLTFLYTASSQFMLAAAHFVLFRRQRRPWWVVSMNFHVFFLLEESWIFMYLAHLAVFRWRTINALNITSWLPALQGNVVNRESWSYVPVWEYSMRGWFLIAWWWITWFLGYGIWG
jgi:hypothetical protein